MPTCIVRIGSAQIVESKGVPEGYVIPVRSNHVLYMHIIKCILALGGIDTPEDAFSSLLFLKDPFPTVYSQSPF